MAARLKQNFLVLFKVYHEIEKVRADKARTTRKNDEPTRYAYFINAILLSGIPYVFQ
jgi:hypothetical protein